MHRRLTAAALVLTVALVAVAAGQRVAPERGTSGDDRLVGTPRSDELRGLAGDDVLIGRAGADILVGNEGSDDLRGGPGRDTVTGGPGPDRLSGGRGNDVVFAGERKADRDVVTCGPGDDLAMGDARDVLAADCEFPRLTLPVATAATTVGVEFLGWASLARARDPGVVTAVPSGAVPSGGTLTGCALSDRRVSAYFRMRGVTRPTATRTVLIFPAGPPFVDLNSVAPRDEGTLLLYNFVRGSSGPRDPLANGTYAIRFQVAAGGVYTTVAEATVTRACA